MPRNEIPELVDWEDLMPPPDSRFFGFVPALALSALAGAALFSNCRPNYYYYGWRDYYTCSPKYVCRPLPYGGNQF